MSHVPFATPVDGPVEHFMVADHVRVDRLMERCERSRVRVPRLAFAQLRAGMLRHMAMEERILLPYLSARLGSEIVDLARQIRSEHTEIAHLLAQPPTPALVLALCAFVAEHNRLEEGPSGLYALCDAVAGREARTLVECLKAIPELSVVHARDEAPRRREATSPPRS